MTLEQLVSDNPILIKHVRSRLRRQHLLPALIAVVVISLFIVWAGFTGSDQESAFIGIIVFQCLILLIAGTSQVATTVAQARESGILDFHRVSPQSPLCMALGFLLGAPIREYILYLCTLPFLFLVAAGERVPSVPWIAVIVIATIPVALLYHTAGLLAGVLSTRARGSGPWIVVLCAIMLLGGLTSPGAGIFTIVPAARQALDSVPTRTVYAYAVRETAHSFYFVPMPPALHALLHQVPVLAFLFIAAVRKMRNDRAMLYSKPVAVVFLGMLAFLILGDVFRLDLGRGAFSDLSELPQYLTVYSLTLASVLLAVAITPGAGDFANGVRRARKRGQSQLPQWDDFSANWAPLIAFSIVTLVTSLVAASAQVLGSTSTSVSPLGALYAGCVVFYFGSAKQYFDLRFRKNSASYFALFLFMLWLVPLLLGAVTASALGPELSQSIMGVSPLVGLSTTVFARDPSLAGFHLIVAIFLAVGFAILRLKAEKEARGGALSTVR